MFSCPFCKKIIQIKTSFQNKNGFFFQNEKTFLSKIIFLIPRKMFLLWDHFLSTAQETRRTIHPGANKPQTILVGNETWNCSVFSAWGKFSGFQQGLSEISGRLRTAADSVSMFLLWRHQIETFGPNYQRINIRITQIFLWRNWNTFSFLRIQELYTTSYRVAQHDSLPTYSPALSSLQFWN